MTESESQVSKTESDEKLPLSQKVHFGIGFTSHNLMMMGVEHMLFPVYSLYLGLSPAYIGFAIIFPTIWDGLMGIIVGQYSDNLKTRWGRRKPLIILGAIASSIAFILIWMAPPSWGKDAIAAWLVASLVLFWSTNAIYFVPLDALGLSLTSGYNDRTSLMAFRSFFAKVGQLASGWCFWLVEKGWFGEEQNGAIVVGIIWAIIALSLGLWAGFHLKERQTPQAQIRKKIKWWASLKVAIKSNTFLRITGFLVFTTASLSITNAVHFYANLHYVSQGDTELASELTGVSISLNIISGIIALPIVSWTSSRIGKHRVAQIAVGLTGFGSLSSWILMTPNNPWLSLCIAPTIGMGIVAVFQLYFSMLADAAEEARLRNDVRNEGIYSAISSSLVKIGQTIAIAGSGLMLTGIGIEGKEFIPSSEQLAWLRSIRAIGPAILTAVAIACLAGYPLTESTLIKLREKNKK